MAAYGALVSVVHIIDQLQLHPRPPISLEGKQAESLTEKVTFLQDFLEHCSHVNSQEIDDLESRIAAAAYAAEDVIESHIVDQIHAGSTSHCGKKISSADFYQDLQNVINDLDSIQKEAMEIKEKIGVQRDQLHASSTTSSGSSRSASTGQNRTKMVGFDGVMVEMMDKVVGGELDRQIIPIVGMGGSGKTTLARNIYEHKVVVEHFDILAWVTISQEYSLKKILVEVLQEGGENLSEDKLREKLHKKLWGRRYLVILDDLWDIELFHVLKSFFPNNKNGSRVMLTTRLSMLDSQLIESHGHKMNFLDEDTSWDLFCKTVFGNEDFPGELKEIGREIVKNCKGLPLSIVVIGGLLAESRLQTQDYWEHIAQNLNSVVNLEDDERCLKILYASYKHLPFHLRPCFLYMGFFREDSEIRVSNLIQLWVAEGFLKPIGGKTLEEVAEQYLKELISRNLILVHKYGSNGRIRLCKIHDLLRDLCLRECQKHKFLCVAKPVTPFVNSWDIGNTGGRICNHKYYYIMKSDSLARSFIWDFEAPSPSLSFRLLRVSSNYFAVNSVRDYFEQVNLRYLHFRGAVSLQWVFSSSFSLLWNLQTIKIIDSLASDPVIQIWEMPQLRHVEIKYFKLPDPPNGNTDERDDIVLKNLQTLSWITESKFSEEVVRRIPNVKKLKLLLRESAKESPDYCLNNLGLLHKLENLYCQVHRNVSTPSRVMQNLTFPDSLKKLSLEGTKLQWEELTTKIGSIPFLEVLKLKEGSCIGPHWETVEGKFCSLKFLLIDRCYDLKYWTTEDSTHFPRLEHLHLVFLKGLTEIPSSIGDIPTIQSIHLSY